MLIPLAYEGDLRPGADRPRVTGLTGEQVASTVSVVSAVASTRERCSLLELGEEQCPRFEVLDDVAAEALDSCGHGIDQGPVDLSPCGARIAQQQ